jgi:outer membrane immunogenic protein
MNRLIIASTLLVAFASGAKAADAVSIDTAAPAGFVWTGGYVGLQGGYGWGDSHHFATGAASPTFDIDGFIGGVTAGYNYQINQVVIGVETDISYANVKGGTSESSDTWGCGDGCETEVKWFGTLRGRLGYAMDNTLPYITGGLAYGGAEANPDIAGYGGKDTLFGWTAGAGIEHAFTPNWTVKAEYLYVDLGDVDLADFGAPFGRGHVDVNFNTVRIGLNYKF